jgi:hypothetical protein
MDTQYMMVAYLDWEEVVNMKSWAVEPQAHLWMMVVKEEQTAA